MPAVGKRRVFGKACVLCGRRRYCHLSPTGCWQTYNDSISLADFRKPSKETVATVNPGYGRGSDIEGVRSEAK